MNCYTNIRPREVVRKYFLPINLGIWSHFIRATISRCQHQRILASVGSSRQTCARKTTTLGLRGDPPGEEHICCHVGNAGEPLHRCSMNERIVCHSIDKCLAFGAQFWWLHGCLFWWFANRGIGSLTRQSTLSVTFYYLSKREFTMKNTLVTTKNWLQILSLYNENRNSF